LFVGGAEHRLFDLARGKPVLDRQSRFERSGRSSGPVVGPEVCTVFCEFRAKQPLCRGWPGLHGTNFGTESAEKAFSRSGRDSRGWKVLSRRFHRCAGSAVIQCRAPGPRAGRRRPPSKKFVRDQRRQFSFRPPAKEVRAILCRRSISDGKYKKRQDNAVAGVFEQADRWWL